MSNINMGSQLSKDFILRTETAVEAGKKAIEPEKVVEGRKFSLIRTLSLAISSAGSKLSSVGEAMFSGAKKIYSKAKEIFSEPSTPPQPLQRKSISLLSQGSQGVQAQESDFVMEIQQCANSLYRESFSRTIKSDELGKIQNHLIEMINKARSNGIDVDNLEITLGTGQAAFKVKPLEFFILERFEPPAALLTDPPDRKKILQEIGVDPKYICDKHEEARAAQKKIIDSEGAINHPIIWPSSTSPGKFSMLFPDGSIRSCTPEVLKENIEFYKKGQGGEVDRKKILEKRRPGRTRSC